VVQHIEGPDEHVARVDKMARSEAKSLGPLLYEGQQKTGTKEAGPIGQQIVDTIQSLQDRHGQEVAKETVRQSGLEAVRIRQKEEAAMARTQERAAASSTATERGIRLRKALKMGDPTEKLRQHVAEITERGGAQNPQEQAILDTYQRTSPLDIIVNQKVNEAFGKGREGRTGPRPATDADVQSIQKETGINDASQLRAEVLKRGFTLGE
jgi:hypothetical protein